MFSRYRPRYRRRFRRRPLAFRRKRMPFRRKTYKPTMGKQIGFPRKLTLKMKTAAYQAVAPAAVSEHYTYKLNSAFDPLGGDGAEQPNGWDQVAAVLYNSYYVSSGMIRARFVNETANAVDCVLWVTAEDAEPASFHAMIERGGAQYKICGKAGDAGNGIILSRRFVSKKILGKKYGTQNMSAAVTADPTDVVYGHISFYSHSQAGAANIIGTLVLEIYQTVHFYDKIDLAES